MKRQPGSSPRSTRNQRTVSIIGTGSYAPDKILTNEDLSRMVDTSDEWITTRTGIKERRIAAKDEMTSDMAAKAALKALEQAQISPEDVQLLLVATATPDMIFPATACFVQKIGAKMPPASMFRPPALDSLFGFEIAQQFITSGPDTALVIGADKRHGLPTGRSKYLCAFCDGGWRAVAGHRGSAHGVGTNMGSDGEYTDIFVHAGWDQKRRSRPRTHI